MRVLVSGTINRPDILAMFAKATDVDFVFVEYESVLESRTNYVNYGPVFSWREFSSAVDLLDRVRPDKVVLLFNSSYNQVALRIAARSQHIPVVHLEHGFRLPVESQAFKDNSRRAIEYEKRDWSRLMSEPLEIARNNRFLLGTIWSLPEPARWELLDYLKHTYLAGAHTDALAATARIRRCDAYLAYAPAEFEFHRVRDALSVDTPVEFLGIPQFDDFTASSSDSVDADVVLYIDHQYVNVGYFGWTTNYRVTWVEDFVRATQRAGKQLMVKTHPADNQHVWDRYVESGEVVVLSREELGTIAPSIGTVTGTISTILLPFLAMRDVLGIGIEIHPEAGHHPSSILENAGVLRSVFDWNNYTDILIQRKTVLKDQSIAKASFERQFLYQLDQAGGRRLRDALLRPLSLT